MAFLFPSPEWCAECMKKLNESEAVATTGGVGAEDKDRTVEADRTTK